MVTFANRLDNPAYQAQKILHLGFTVAPIIAGIDKFFNALVDWSKYLSPTVVPGWFSIDPHTFMRIVGGIEIAAGDGVHEAIRAWHRSVHSLNQTNQTLAIDRDRRSALADISAAPPIGRRCLPVGARHTAFLQSLRIEYAN